MLSVAAVVEEPFWQFALVGMDENFSHVLEELEVNIRIACALLVGQRVGRVKELCQV